VVLLEGAGYSRCFEPRDLRDKEYRIDEGVVTLEGQQGSCAFKFDDTGKLIGQEILEWS
jgi:hypothetical protein